MSLRRSLKPTGVVSGFTLVELLVVLAIVATLLTLVVPRYFGSIDASKEAVLKENLSVVRKTIDQFYGDLGRYPESDSARGEAAEQREPGRPGEEVDR